MQAKLDSQAKFMLLLNCERKTNPNFTYWINAIFRNLMRPFMKTWLCPVHTKPFNVMNHACLDRTYAVEIYGVDHLNDDGNSADVDDVLSPTESETHLNHL